MCVDIEINLTDTEHDNAMALITKTTCDPCSIALYESNRESGMDKFEALGRAVYNTHLVKCLKLGINEDKTKIEGKL